MNVDLADKVAIVTGAGQGIGEGIARVFARCGASVVVATRTQSNGESVCNSICAAGGTAFMIKADVGDRNQVKSVISQTMERFKRIDIVIHNAGVYPIQSIDTLSDDELDRTLNVNLKAGFWFIQEAVPHMRKTGGGRFIFTSSVTGPNVAMPGTAHYAASKSGLNGLIRTAALEYARQNITVNGVEPGYILTPAMQALGGDDAIKEMAAQIPLGKLGSPTDIAYAMLFLASDAASYITGQTLVVDGGSTLPESPVMLQSYYQESGKA